MSEFTLTRRDVFRLLAASAAVLQLPAAEPGAPLFFSREQFALVDQLSELIIPTDSHSPGARAAGVAAYIDRSIAESTDPADKQIWQAGLRGIDALSQSQQGAAFMTLNTDGQIAVLKQMAAHEPDPQNDNERYFNTLKAAIVFAYYTSQIGIHREMEYKGNTILQQYVGYEVQGPALAPHP